MIAVEFSPETAKALERLAIRLGLDVAALLRYGAEAIVTSYHQKPPFHLLEIVDSIDNPSEAAELKAGRRLEKADARWLARPDRTTIAKTRWGVTAAGRRLLRGAQQ